MNILYISHENELNGATLSLLGIIDELSKDNNIYVLSKYKEGNFIEELKKRNITIINTNYAMWIRPKKKGFRSIEDKISSFFKCNLNYLNAIKIKKIIKKENIDIIHSNTSVVNIGAILSRYLNIPHIWHIREFGKEDFNFSYSFGRNYTYKFINRNSNKIIAISKAIYKNFEKYIDKNKMVVIYNGVDKRNLNSKTFIKNGQVNLIISGRVCEDKGQRDAILAINELICRGYKNILLNVAGSGKIDELKDIINKLGIEKNIRFLGHVKNLSEIRKNIDIELVCSRCEAFGRVTIEAMMGMIPVIGSNTGGTIELIKDNYNGFLYEQGNYIDLANKIEIILNDNDKLISMGKNAYNFAEKFTSKNNAMQIEKLYKDILKLKN